MSLEGIAISGRGALAQALRIESIIAKNGQLVGLGKSENGQRVGKQYGEVNGQLVGLGQYGQLEGNGQRVGMEFEAVARQAWSADRLEEQRISPLLQTAELFQALRALEANLQALRIQDATLERTVNDLARPAK